jgi:hypothetical protein
MARKGGRKKEERKKGRKIYSIMFYSVLFYSITLHYSLSVRILEDDTASDPGPADCAKRLNNQLIAHVGAILEYLCMDLFLFCCSCSSASRNNHC